MVEIKVKAFLFDMDGVVTDTEPQYDALWESMQKEYRPEIPDLHRKVKGTTLPDIIQRYFSDFTEERKAELVGKIMDFEMNQMVYKEVAGATSFIKSLKDNGIKAALVTSSYNEKVDIALKSLGLDDAFDVLVTSDDVRRGKPDPQCYLKAAEKLKLNPLECIVFEDSLAGLKAGRAARMRVVGLSTTLPYSTVRELTRDVLPNFEGVSVESIIG